MTPATQDDGNHNDTVDDGVPTQQMPPLQAWWSMITTGVRRRREVGLSEHVKGASVDPKQDCAVAMLSKLSFATEESREWTSMERQSTMELVEDHTASQSSFTEEAAIIPPREHERAVPPLAKLKRSGPSSLFDPPEDDDEDDEDDQLEMLLEAVDTTTNDAIQSMLPKTTAKEFDLKAFANKREMTETQERWNALTMLPSIIVPAYFILAGCWLAAAAVDEALRGQEELPLEGCFHWSWLPRLHSMPPLPTAIMALGFIVHTPFSFIYHWVFAHRLNAEQRMAHWSRRCDQAFIHFSAACSSFGTTGSWDYFLINALFNLDSMRRLFKPKIRPRAAQVRVLAATLAFLVPVFRLDVQLATGITLVTAVGFWFFAVYPVGGWSHAVFHLFICSGAYPMILMASAAVPASQPQIQLAAQCAAAAY